MQKTFEARTEKEAVEQAVRTLGVNAEYLEVEVLQKKSGGLFNRNDKVVIKASVIGLPSSEEYESHPPQQSQSYNEIEPIKEEISQEKQEQICWIVQNLIKKMGIDIECSFSLEDNFYIVTMDALHEADQNILIGKHGKNIEAIQNISNSIIQNQIDDFPSHIVIDIEKYRSKRTEWLSSIARKKSEQVLHTGKSFLLDELGPFDRKLIHKVVKNYDGVTTISKGNGYYKRVKIYLDN